MRRYLFLLTFIAFAGCEEVPTQQEFPVLMTLTADDVNENGATLRAEVLKKGKTETISYGFIWDSAVPDPSKSKRIVLGTSVGEGLFEKRIESGLTKGLQYQIRAFATYRVAGKDRTVYGNIVTLESKGSTNNIWSVESKSVPLSGWFDSYGSSNDKNGYVLFQDGTLHVFDPDKNEFSAGPKFPVSGNSGTQYTAVTVGGDQYFFNGVGRNLYCLSNGNWKVESQTPFSYSYFGGYYQGAFYQDNIYILSSTQSYRYNPKTKAWQVRSVPSVAWASYSTGGVAWKDKAYLITTKSDVWEYTFATDKWVLKTKYPGRMKDKIVTFSQGDKIYMGLSYYDHYVQKDWMDKEMWSYDPVNDKWELLDQLFPADAPSSNLFSFSLKDKLYFGYGSNTYAIWTFDPSNSK